MHKISQPPQPHILSLLQAKNTTKIMTYLSLMMRRKNNPHPGRVKWTRKISIGKKDLKKLRRCQKNSLQSSVRNFKIVLFLAILKILKKMWQNHKQPFSLTPEWKGEKVIGKFECMFRFLRKNAFQCTLQMFPKTSK